MATGRDLAVGWGMAPVGLYKECVFCLNIHLLRSKAPGCLSQKTFKSNGITALIICQNEAKVKHPGQPRFRWQTDVLVFCDMRTWAGQIVSWDVIRSCHHKTRWTPYWICHQGICEMRAKDGLMLAQRLRRWPNIRPALGQLVVIRWIHSILSLSFWTH